MDGRGFQASRSRSRKVWSSTTKFALVLRPSHRRTPSATWRRSAEPPWLRPTPPVWLHSCSARIRTSLRNKFARSFAPARTISVRPDGIRCSAMAASTRSAPFSKRRKLRQSVLRTASEFRGRFHIDIIEFPLNHRRYSYAMRPLRILHKSHGDGWNHPRERDFSNFIFVACSFAVTNLETTINNSCAGVRHVCSLHSADQQYRVPFSV